MQIKGKNGVELPRRGRNVQELKSQGPDCTSRQNLKHPGAKTSLSKVEGPGENTEGLNSVTYKRKGPPCKFKK